MAAPFDPNKCVHVGESMSSEVAVLVDVPVLDWKSAMEMNWPLPPLPPHHYSNSNVSSTPAKSRAAGPSLDEAIEYELKHGSKNIDPRTLRRTISNRRAARRSRIKRCQHKIDLEKKHKDLEELVKSLNSQIEICKEKNRADQEENISLRTAVAIRTNQENIAQDNMEEMWREMIRLKEKLRNQNQDTKSSSVAEELIDHHHHELMNIRAEPEPEPDSMTGLINFDDDGVDQYLNLDEMNLDLNFDPGV